MNTHLLALVAVLALLLTGCAKTVVVLIPDEEGKVGQVSVATAGGEQTLSEAGQATEVAAEGAAPSAPQVMSQGEIDKTFGAALSAAPTAPPRFSLYFGSDSDELKPESSVIIPDIKAAIDKRASCYIAIIGHTDRMGDEAYNVQLSLRRANKARSELMKLGVDDQCMEVLSYGEQDPVVPTADNVSEPRNRRVEVLVR